MAVKDALAKKADVSVSASPQKNMRQWIQAMKPEIEKALPSVITPERFTRMATTAISASAALAESTPTSFIGALMQAAQLGLEPNTPLGQAYLIPFKNKSKGVVECQFQIGYKGLIDLAHRSGEFRNIEARVVYENDCFEYEYGLEPKLVHKPARSGRGKPIYYYAVFTLVNGGFGFEVMSTEDVTAHARKFSKAFNRGPWQTDFDEMAKKTVLKKVLKYAPIKTEFVKQVGTDESVKSVIDQDMTDVQNEIAWADYDVVEDESPDTGSAELAETAEKE